MLEDKQPVLGRTFVRQLGEEAVLQIGTETWSRDRMVRELQTGNFRAGRILTKALRRTGVRNVAGLAAMDPMTLVRRKGVGTTTLYVAMCALEARGHDPLGWWGERKGFASVKGRARRDGDGG